MSESDKVLARRELGGTVDILYRDIGDGTGAHGPIMDMPRHTTAFDYNAGGSPVYIGKAAFGSAKSAAVWQIQRLVYTGDNLTDILWADGDTEFDNVWDNRAGLSYS
jgi:hypothetical protein